MAKLLLLKILYGNRFLSRERASVKCHLHKNRQKVLFREWVPGSEDITVCNPVKPCYLVEGMRLGKNLGMPRVRVLDLGL